MAVFTCYDTVNSKWGNDNTSEAVIDAIRPMPGHRTRILGAIEDMRAGGPPYTGRAPAAAPAPAATPPSRSPVPSDDESGGSLPEMM